MEDEEADARRKRIIRAVLLVGGFVAVLGLFILGNILSNSHTKKQDAQNAKVLEGGVRVDKNSGQTIDSPSGKTQDTYGIPANTPLYLGFDSFLNNGLSSMQLQALKQAFYNYATGDGRKISQVSITKNSVSSPPIDPNNTSDTTPYSFTVAFNGADTLYKGTVNATGLDTIQLLLYDPSTNAQIFDSGQLQGSAATQ